MYKRNDFENMIILSKNEDAPGGGLVFSEIIINTDTMTYRKSGGELTYEDTLIIGEIMREFTLDGVLESNGFEKVVDKKHHEVWSNEDWYGIPIYIDIEGSDVYLSIDGWGRITFGDPTMWRIFWSEIEKRVKDDI